MVEIAVFGLVLVFDALCFFATGLRLIVCFGIWLRSSLDIDSVQLRHSTQRVESG